MTNTSFNLDVRYRNDPNLLSGSMGDLFCYLKTLQKQALPVDPRYLEKQCHISENIRALSINAMFSVCRLLQLRRSSLFLSVRILDAYFSLRAPHSLQRTDMAVMGFASLMIAVKFEEGGTWSGERFFRKFFERVNSPNPNEMRDQIVQREDTILRYLRFRVNCPTAHSFLKRYELSGQLSQSAKEIARCICERSLFSYGMVKYLPSVVAAAAVSMARVADGLAPWTSALQSDTGYSPSDLQMCIDDLCDSFLEETVSRAREYTALLFEDFSARRSGKDSKVVTMKRLLEVLLSRSENDRNSDGSRVTAHHLLYETYLPQILQTGVDVERAKRQQQESSDSVGKESQPLQPVDGVMHRFPHRVYSRLVTCPPY